MLPLEQPRREIVAPVKTQDTKDTVAVRFGSQEAKKTAAAEAIHNVMDPGTGFFRHRKNSASAE